MTEVVVHARAVRKSYGRLEVVRGIDLEIRAGEIFAFLGPNGAGKTTTLRMVLGLAAPTSGHALVFGRPFVELEHPGTRAPASVPYSRLRIFTADARAAITCASSLRPLACQRAASTRYWRWSTSPARFRIDRQDGARLKPSPRRGSADGRPGRDHQRRPADR
jgi:energy-coupling factor transporter ATP-binding protein EcfA2